MDHGQWYMGEHLERSQFVSKPCEGELMDLSFFGFLTALFEEWWSACFKPDTPPKTNGWNLKIPPLEKRETSTDQQFLGSRLVFRGVDFINNMRNYHDTPFISPNIFVGLIRFLSIPYRFSMYVIFIYIYLIKITRSCRSKIQMDFRAL